MNPHDEQSYDVRIVRHRAKRREITPQEVQAFLDTLPDEAAEAVPMTTRFVTGTMRHPIAASEPSED